MYRVFFVKVLQNGQFIIILFKYEVNVILFQLNYIVKQRLAEVKLAFHERLL